DVLEGNVRPAAEVEGVARRVDVGERPAEVEVGLDRREDGAAAEAGAAVEVDVRGAGHPGGQDVVEPDAGGGEGLERQAVVAADGVLDVDGKREVEGAGQHAVAVHVHAVVGRDRVGVLVVDVQLQEAEPAAGAQVGDGRRDVDGQLGGGLAGHVAG